MKRSVTIKLKAAFLLTVFALHTVVGFACAVGVDMGFNSKHHDDSDETEAVVHIHKDGKKHVHHEKKEHSHNKATAHHKSDKTKDNCCKDKVRQFEQLDKSLPTSLSLLQTTFFTPFVASYVDLVVFRYTNVVRDVKHFVRSDHPPIRDIRIEIQSFQI